MKGWPVVQDDILVLLTASLLLILGYAICIRITGSDRTNED